MLFTCDICEKTLVTMHKDRTRCYICATSEQAWRRQIAREILDQSREEG